MRGVSTELEGGVTTDFFINAAHAQGAADPAGGGLQLFVMIGVFFLIMYFLVIRPQNKRSKEHRNMLAELQSGDEVVTNGGILGKIDSLDEHFVSLRVQGDVVLRVQKQSITALMPKGTYKD